MRSTFMHSSALDMVAQRHVEGRFIPADEPFIFPGVDPAIYRSDGPIILSVKGSRQGVTAAQELMVDFHVARMRDRAELPGRFWNWLTGGKRHGR